MTIREISGEMTDLIMWEAYKALELSGYVSRSKRGTVVNSRSSIINATPLKTLFHVAGHEDFTQFRLMVESQSAKLAAMNAGLSDVELLDQLTAQSKEALQAKNYEELMKLDERFHTSIANMSGNTLIAAVVTVMAEEWRAGIQRNFDAAIRGNQKVFDTMIEQHTAIVDAIRRRDVSAAQLMEQHIRIVTIAE
jgi:GntR family transcriptional repressor for pyruvate dehydrogenase complex